MQVQQLSPEGEGGAVSFHLGADGQPVITRYEKQPENKLLNTIINVGSTEEQVLEALAAATPEELVGSPPWFGGRTALHELAARGWNSIIVKFLEKPGAQIDVMDESETTPLQVAINVHKDETVLLLIEKGARIVEESGRNVLHDICWEGMSTALNLILGNEKIKERLDINAYTKRGMSPLHLTLVSSAIEDPAATAECVRILLAHGADPNQLTSEMGASSVLCALAMYVDDPSVIKILCDAGADVNLPMKESGITPLLRAIDYDKPLCALELIARGAKVDAKDSQDRQPIHAACRMKLPNILEKLIELHADVNAKDNENMTPLHYLFEEFPPPREKPSRDRGYYDMFAAYDEQLQKERELRERIKKGTEECWALLMKANADVNIVGKLGSPILLAASKLRFIKELKERGAQMDVRDDEGNIALHFAALEPNEGCVEFLLECGLDPNAVNNEGNSPLHYAVLRHGAQLHSDEPDSWGVSEAHTEALVAKGADVNRKNNDGYTPLHLQIVKLQQRSSVLTEKGADVNCTDKDGNTILHFLVSMDDEKKAEELLASFVSGAGAKVDIKNNEGKTPADVAEETGHPGFAHLLRGQVLEAMKLGINVSLFSGLLGDKLKELTAGFAPQFLSSSDIEGKWGRPEPALHASLASLGDLIFVHLDHTDLRNCALVCRQFRLWANSDPLWKLLCARRYGSPQHGGVHLKTRQGMSWKGIFWIHYRIEQNFLKGRCTFQSVSELSIKAEKIEGAEEEKPSASNVKAAKLLTRRPAIICLGSSCISVLDSKTLKCTQCIPISDEPQTDQHKGVMVAVEKEDDCYVAVAYEWQATVLLFSLNQNKRTHELVAEGNGYVMDLRLWNDLVIAGFSGDKSCFRAWDIAKGEAIWTIEAEPNSIYGFDADGNLLASGTGFTGDLNIRVYSIADKQCLNKYKGHHDPISLVCVDSASKSIVSAAGSEVCFWDPETGLRKKTEEHSGLSPELLELDPISRTAVSASGSELFLWDVATAERKHVLAAAEPGHQRRSFSALEKQYKQAVYVHVCGRAYVVAAGVGGKDATGTSIEVFDVETGKQVYALKCAERLNSIAVAGPLLVGTCWSPGCVMVYNFQV